jgi:hypothetical protein
MWKEILKSVVSGLFTAIKDWYQAEQAEAAKWAAEARKQQIESLTTGREKESQWLEQAKKSRAAVSVKAWNAGIILCCVMLSGCIRFHVATQRYRPVPPKIERPAIPEKPAELTEREKVLMTYALKLEEMYRTVRQSAIESNREAGLPNPVE